MPNEKFILNDTVKITVPVFGLNRGATGTICFIDENQSSVRLSEYGENVFWMGYLELISRHPANIPVSRQIRTDTIHYHDISKPIDFERFVKGLQKDIEHITRGRKGSNIKSYAKLADTGEIVFYIEFDRLEDDFEARLRLKKEEVMLITEEMADLKRYIEHCDVLDSKWNILEMDTNYTKAKLRLKELTENMEKLAKAIMAEYGKLILDP